MCGDLRFFRDSGGVGHTLRSVVSEFAFFILMLLIWEVFLKSKYNINVLYGPAVPTLGVCLSRMKTHTHVRRCPHADGSLMHNGCRLQMVSYLLVRGWKSRVTQHRRTRVLMTLRAWGRLEHVTLGERKKLQKFPYCVVLFLWNVQNKHVCGGRKQVGSCLGAKLILPQRINWKWVWGISLDCWESSKTRLWWC